MSVGGWLAADTTGAADAVDAKASDASDSAAVLTDGGDDA